MILTIMLLCDYCDLPVLFFPPLKEILGYNRLISTQPPDFPAQQLGMYHTSTSGQLVKLECVLCSIVADAENISRSTDFMRIYAEPPKATWFDSLAGDNVH